MRRYQFVLNTNTGEIHDLDRECEECLLDIMLPEHAAYCDSYTEALYIADLRCPEKIANGCYHCIPEKHINFCPTQEPNGCFWCLNEYHTD